MPYSKQIFLTSSVSKVAQKIAQKTYNRNILFIDTAAELDFEPGNEPDWLMEDKNALDKAGFILTDFSFTGKSQAEIKQAFDNQEGIYLSGGNTLYLLQQIQKSGVETILKEKIEQGFLYIGTSAGSVVACPDIEYIAPFEDATQAPDLTNTTGMILCDFLILVHWGSKFFESGYRKEVIMKAYQEPYPMVVLRDEDYVQVLDQGIDIVRGT